MSIVSGIMGANAAEDAAETGAGATRDASATQLQMFREQQTAMEPWRASGVNALNRMNAMLGLPTTEGATSPSGWQDLMDPGYAFRKQEGVNALLASGSASGMYGSGNLGVALENYGQNIASNEFQNVYNRLAGLSGTGQVQSQQIGNMGLQTGQGIGQNTIAAGNALAAGTLGRANAWANTSQNLSNQGMSGLGTYLNWQAYQNQLNRINSNQFYGDLYNKSWTSPEGWNYGGYGDASGAAF